eukprot:436768-Pleurochrysis_carterae.AAC.1
MSTEQGEASDEGGRRKRGGECNEEGLDDAAAGQLCCGDGIRSDIEEARVAVAAHTTRCGGDG